jgi:hypothetical protein
MQIQNVENIKLFEENDVIRSSYEIVQRSISSSGTAILIARQCTIVLSVMMGLKPLGEKE